MRLSVHRTYINTLKSAQTQVSYPSRPNIHLAASISQQQMTRGFLYPYQQNPTLEFHSSQHAPNSAYQMNPNSAYSSSPIPTLAAAAEYEPRARLRFGGGLVFSFLSFPSINHPSVHHPSHPVQLLSLSPRTVRTNALFASHLRWR